MEKRLIIAIALSILVFLAFQSFAVKPPPTPIREKVETQGAVEKFKEAVAEPPAEADLLAREKEFEAETDSYILTFSNIGGAIKGIRLKDYNEIGREEPLQLVQIKNPRNYIFAISGLSSDSHLNNLIFRFEKSKDLVTSYSQSGDIRVTKIYIFHKGKNYIELSLKIENLSGSAKVLPIRIIGGAGVIEKSQDGNRFVEVISKINGNIVGFKNPRDKRISNPGIVEWTTLKNKYFSIVLLPPSSAKSRFYEDIKEDGLVDGVDLEQVTLNPDESFETSFKLYVGPSNIKALRNSGLPIEDTLNYGFFGFISKVLLASLDFFHKVFRNWGVSIIVLAIILNVILYPLTMQSFKSMKKMQEIQPQIEKIRAQSKDNAQKMNKEIMELYKKYNINPFSGCLPLLLQMPIFIALYQAFMKSIDLRSAGFLWIRDLSSPDAVKIPLTLPILGNSVNVLPLIMIFFMFLQQKLSTKISGAAATDEQRQQQKIMLIMMPIVFGFVFYNMPSGLVLYWVVNTVLTTTEQALIYRNA